MDDGARHSLALILIALAFVLIREAWRWLLGKLARWRIGLD